VSRPNDARLWALMLTPLRAAGIGADAERVARQLVALVCSERDCSRRTFAPGEELPEPPPERVYDLDGAVWEHQSAGHGCYRMSQADRDQYDNSDFEGACGCGRTCSTPKGRSRH
jgi:hypothetical protein